MITPKCVTKKTLLVLVLVSVVRLEETVASNPLIKPLPHCTNSPLLLLGVSFGDFLSRERIHANFY